MGCLKRRIPVDALTLEALELDAERAFAIAKVSFAFREGVLPIGDLVLKRCQRALSIAELFVPRRYRALPCRQLFVAGGQRAFAIDQLELLCRKLRPSSGQRVLV